MDEVLAIGSTPYWWMLGLLAFARAMDFLSTWVATPNLTLEANPIARLLGWKWGALVNAVLCVLAAQWPLAAVVLITTSLLVAARNFKSAWFMRALGEDRYRALAGELMEASSGRLILVCVSGETLLFALIGAAVVFFGRHELVIVAIGIGFVAYAGAVAFYTALGVWRARRSIR
jgi:hypothetical protein